MLNIFSNLNWIAISIGIILNTLLGGLWFTLIFGKQYASALGREYNPNEKPALIFILGPLICGAITILSMAVLIYLLEINNLKDGLLFGGLIGFGITGATNFNSGINPNIPHPIKYGIVSGSFFVTISILVSVLLVVMK